MEPQVDPLVYMRPFLLLLFLGCLLAWGAEWPAPAGAGGESGYPFVTNYTPRVYGGDAQNWAVLQDSRGLIYVGNNRGVLEYDGVRWTLIPTTRHTVVRSLGMDAQGRVYVGAVGEIGCLVPNDHGEIHFQSLNERLPDSVRTFSDVWATLATPRGVLFQTREFLFLVRKDRVEVVPAQTTFHVAFAVGRRLFVRQRDLGLQEWTRQGLTLVPGGKRFAKTSVFTMLPLGGDGSILIGTRDEGLWKLDGSGLHPFPTPATAYLKGHALYSGARLADGTLALATIQGGVVLLDPQGRVLGLLDRRAGLQSDNVKALFADRGNGLWMALDNGISRAEWPSPLSAFDERAGLKGTVWGIQHYQGRLYAATGQGAFVLAPSRERMDPRPDFKPLPGVGTQSLAFLPLEDRLLLGTAQGVFEIRGGKARLVRPSSNVAICFLRDGKDPSLLYLGMQGGLVALWHPPGSNLWKDLGVVPGVQDDIYSMVQDGEGRLWLGTGAQGALRLAFPRDVREGAPMPAPRIERFGAPQGLVSVMQPILFAWRGEVLAATQQGVMQYDERLHGFRAEPRFAALFPEGPRLVKVVRVEGLNRVWMDTLDEARGIHEAGVAIRLPDGRLSWQAAPYRRFAELSIEAIAVDASGVVWFGGPSGILRYDPARDHSGEAPESVLIRKVSLGEAVIAGGAGALPTEAAPETLPLLPGALRFEFASPAYDEESANLYQTRLEGYERDWSSWSREPQKEYTNLPEGTYRFLVRARDVYGRYSPVQAFTFRVRAPWYRTRWAFVGYLALGVLGLMLGLRLWTGLLRRRNAALQARIDRATEELRERERMLAAQAGALERMNGQLLELNEQKSRFLSIVAHDLRNPLTGILLSSQIIEEEEDLEEIHRRAALIVQEGASMEGLIGRFLDLSALETGGIRTEPGAVSLPALLRELVTRHADGAARKEIRLEVDAPADEGWVFADPKFVAAVVDNLISNALKFSPPGKTVWLQVEARGAWIRLAVRDEGPGLTEEDRKRLFGRFARLSAKPTAGEQSVGLGLSIAKQMVEACGGRIWAESLPGQGATFLVELPRRPA